MKPTCSLLSLCLALSWPAEAFAEAARPAPAATAEKNAPAEDNSLNFDFFSQPPDAKAGASSTGAPLRLDHPDLAAQARTRRWMLTTHQALGITTWALLAATVVVGQLNYGELYGGGSGSKKYQTPHRWLVLSTSLAFVTTASFSIFAPSPYDKPLRFDTGLIHRIAVIGATAGMLTEIALGWIATHQAAAGNPNHLRTYARAHQIVGFTTLGFLTVAGLVWVF